jgi:hypothetical protein
MSHHADAIGMRLHPSETGPIEHLLDFEIFALDRHVLCFVEIDVVDCIGVRVARVGACSMAMALPDQLNSYRSGWVSAASPTSASGFSYRKGFRTRVPPL